MATVFYDFDGTLVKHDSLIRFARFSLPSFRFFFGLIKSAPWVLAWKLKFLTSSYAKEKLFGFWFKGMPEETFDRKGLEFMSEINKDINNEVFQTLISHKKDGKKIVIVSASMENWIKPWAKANGIDIVIGTRPATSPGGVLSGKFATLNCIGEEKVRRIKELFPNLNTTETWGYGDSPSDQPMLSIVNHPHMV